MAIDADTVPDWDPTAYAPTIAARIAGASNASFLISYDGGPLRYAIYKPVAGERPLWDFPDGTLAGREVAAYRIARAAGWGFIPPTLWWEGPAGPGSVQQWVGDPYADSDLAQVVDVIPAGEPIPDGWLSVLKAENGDGEDVELIHDGASDVRSMAVFDALINNSDRKGTHCVRDLEGRLMGFDHGVSLHTDPKLRTVLWGWVGQPLAEADVAALRSLADDWESLAAQLADLLPAGDLAALRRRLSDLLADPRHPAPAPGWPAIPWPAL